MTAVASHDADCTEVRQTSRQERLVRLPEAIGSVMRVARCNLHGATWQSCLVECHDARASVRVISMNEAQKCCEGGGQEGRRRRPAFLLTLASSSPLHSICRFNPQGGAGALRPQDTSSPGRTMQIVALAGVRADNGLSHTEMPFGRRD